ncbi:MAG TPA: peptidylprolyl isomerase, partial [Saprospiraceae bacterium]|nr:peptidylprolyl isomerase [Saprospiraceae bacterium]
MFQKVNIYLFFLLVFLTSCAKPMASFMVNTKDNTAPAKVNFDNQSKKAETYLWDFGDGTTSTEISPKHKYITSGKYTVKLTATKGKKTHTMEKELIFEAPHDCLVEMETTLGSITIKLHDSTPQHRDNFIKLAETEYYDNMLFHRVINGFMIQGGDPDSKNAKKGQRLGVGGPGYTVPAEFVDGLIHIKGA